MLRLTKLTVFGYGFRAMFLLASLWSSVAIATWLVMLSTGTGAAVIAPVTPQAWHGHEMIFGFAGAAIAGFLLTATPNWTGTPPLAGPPLVALAAAWCVARLAFLAPVPAHLIAAAVADALFSALLAWAVVPRLWRQAGAWNRLAAAIVGAYVAANLTFWVAIFAPSVLDPRAVLYASVDLVLLLISHVTGRLVPVFMKRDLKSDDPRLAVEPRGVGASVELSVAALALLDLAAPASRAAGVACVVAGVAAAARLWCWLSPLVLRKPLLWVLQLGQMLLALGFAGRGLAHFSGALRDSTALHLLTMGGMGLLILGIMSRASLGHTGRPLALPAGTCAAYALVLLATAVRVTADSWSFQAATHGAGALWIAAFAIFAVRFLPILLAPRVDGRPG
ncbi:MAG: NnrS family protein [Candidatus Schekmanbacteria bacterium]|nr:NnrS family protein [Candidatus Schekmanbacteria bacterium]